MVIKELSKQLNDCINNKSKLRVCFYENKKEHERYFYIPLYPYGKQGYYMFFDPWTGLEIDETFNVYAQYAEFSRRARYEHSQFYGYIYDANADSQVTRGNWEREIEQGRKKHRSFSECYRLARFIKGGEKAGMTSINYVLGVYIILSRTKEFEIMNYCPFCGAELPKLSEKLDEVLLLRDDFGLHNPQDYDLLLQNSSMFNTNEEEFRTDGTFDYCIKKTTTRSVRLEVYTKIKDKLMPFGECDPDSGQLFSDSFLTMNDRRAIEMN